MALESVLAAIDREIAQLQKVRALFNNEEPASGKTPAKRRGRPPKAAPLQAKRQLSEEARARIAAGQKKRWAAQKTDEGE